MKKRRVRLSEDNCVSYISKKKSGKALTMADRKWLVQQT